MAILKENGWLVSKPGIDNRAAVARLAAAMMWVRKGKG